MYMSHPGNDKVNEAKLEARMELGPKKDFFIKDFGKHRKGSRANYSYPGTGIHGGNPQPTN